MTAAAPVRSPLVSLLRAVGWLGALALGHVGLMAAGTALPTPPAPVPFDAFLEWLQAGDVAQTSFSILRVVGLVTIWYLAAITVLVLLARISGLRPLAFLAHRLALPWARRLVNNALGAGLAVTLAGGIAPIAGMGMAAAAPAPITTVVDHPDAQVATMTAIDDVAVLEQLPGDESARPLPIGRSLARATAAMHLMADEAEPATWTIAPGDHLWHVAAATLEARWERPPTDREIAPYWQSLIEHNRGRLVVADEPDLVYPGQVFELPPVPPAPAG